MHPFLMNRERTITLSDHEAIVLQHALSVAREKFVDMADREKQCVRWGAADSRRFHELTEAEYRDKVDLMDRLLVDVEAMWRRNPNG